ncbi:hypothetical protein HDV06_000436 [Boothiomyces sp. JEL0866]|nr:hypothetical protein HDV06_000436 [Boothiomyces sp. JEL0866]
MGKRKSTTRKPQKKLKTVLDKSFPCFFCSHEDTVTVKFNQQQKVATLKSLTEPVDVYSDWLDVCEEVNKNHKPQEEQEQDDSDFD